MGDASIELWMNQHQFDALERILTESGTNVETVMHARLMEFYRQTVPDLERVDINNRIESERLATERREAENRRFSVFRVTENGSSVCLECELPFGFMQAANQTRRYLRKELEKQPDTLAEYFLRVGTQITEERFGELVGERIEGSRNITGLCDIDLDGGRFHTARHLNGWASFNLKDVTTAVYRAYRKDFRSVDDRWRIFLEHLDGKLITESPEETDGHRRLTKDDVRFSDEIMESDGKLNFYMDTDFNVDQVFGTHVETPDNDDWLNVYADYDMEQRQVCDTLDVVLHRNDDSDEELSYTLNADEKEILLEKMDAYCLEREGVTLDAHCAQLMAEEQGIPMEPRM